MSKVKLLISERYYSKDPLSSDLGKRIVDQGLGLLNKLGFEQFTFKKLANQVGSTEASVYRYFENKQKLLIYLTAWYWSWADYRIDYDTHHISDPTTKLRRIWEIICHIDIPAEDFEIDVSVLRNVVISEADKTYLTKTVDEINKEGLFLDFKSLCHRIAEILLEINPHYQYAHALVSTMMEAAHQQHFFASHLPSLTEIKKGEDSVINHQIHDFIINTMLKVLKQSA